MATMQCKAQGGHKNKYMRAINKNKIIEAEILEPYAGDNYLPFSSPSHGWQVVFIMGYMQDGYPIKIVIDKPTKTECMELILDFGLQWV